MQNMVMVFSGYRIPVEMAKAILDDNNIYNFMASQNGTAFVVQTGGALEEYFLYVRPEDAEVARDLCRFVGDGK